MRLFESVNATFVGAVFTAWWFSQIVNKWILSVGHIDCNFAGKEGIGGIVVSASRKLTLRVHRQSVHWRRRVVVMFFLALPLIVFGSEPADMAGIAEKHAMTILATYPEWATQLGIDELRVGSPVAGRLTSGSIAANDEIRKRLNELLTEWSAIDVDRLTERQRVTHQVLAHAYQLALRHNETGVGAASLLSINPPYVINQLFGPHIDVPRLSTGPASAAITHRCRKLAAASCRIG